MNFKQLSDAIFGCIKDTFQVGKLSVCFSPAHLPPFLLFPSSSNCFLPPSTTPGPAHTIPGPQPLPSHPRCATTSGTSFSDCSPGLHLDFVPYENTFIFHPGWHSVSRTPRRTIIQLANACSLEPRGSVCTPWTPCPRWFGDCLGYVARDKGLWGQHLVLWDVHRVGGWQPKQFCSWGLCVLQAPGHVSPVDVCHR